MGKVLSKKLEVHHIPLVDQWVDVLLNHFLPSSFTIVFQSSLFLYSIIITKENI